MNRIRSWFFTGLIVTVPVLLTIYIIWTAIKIIDKQVTDLLPEPVTGLLPGLATYSEIPGVGLLIGVVLITMIGALAAGFIGRWLIRLGESLLNRMPIARSIYGATKQILETMISTQSDAFREVVLVEYPRNGLWVIGFVTGSTKGEVYTRIDRDMVNVFVPTTPNPTSGFLLFCPKENVVFMDMQVEEAVKMVVSGGIITPPDRSTNNRTAKKTTPKKAASKKAASKKAASKKATQKKVAQKKKSASRTIKVAVLEGLSKIAYYEDASVASAPDNVVDAWHQNARSVGIPYKKVLEGVRAEFPKANTTIDSVRWYTSQVKGGKKGYTGVQMPDRRP